MLLFSYFFYFSLSGNLHLSNFIFERRVVRWSIPLELMDCIAGYEYSFQYSGVSGLLPANTKMLSLDTLNISTPCNVDYLTVSPIYHVQPQPIKNNSIMGCISTGNMWKLIVYSGTHPDLIFDSCENRSTEVYVFFRAHQI